MKKTLLLCLISISNFAMEFKSLHCISETSEIKIQNEKGLFQAVLSLGTTKNVGRLASLTNSDLPWNDIDVMNELELQETLQKSNEDLNFSYESLSRSVEAEIAYMARINKIMDETGILSGNFTSKEEFEDSIMLEVKQSNIELSIRLNDEREDERYLLRKKVIFKNSECEKSNQLISEIK